MAIYQRLGGAWTQLAGRPHVRVPGQGWTPVNAGYVRRNGVWTNFYTYDPTPPPAPVVTAAKVLTTYSDGTSYHQGRHVEVSVTIPGADVADVRRAQLLVSTSGQPTSQYDTSCYIAGTDTTSVAAEPWSEIWYHGYNGSTRSSTATTVTRLWTRNAVDATVVPGGTYYFSAWAEDFAGNWSSGGYTSITLPMNFDADAIFSHTDNYRTWAAGSMVGDNLVRGDQIQSDHPSISRGIYFYNQRLGLIQKTLGDPEITNAQIFLHRRNDSGRDSAFVYLYWHSYPTPDDLPTSGVDHKDVTKIGTIGKGESKWFDIPAAFWPGIASGQIKGFGLNYKDPDNADANPRDYSVMKSREDAVRTGEVRLSWTDTP